mgnify:FL=1
MKKEDVVGPTIESCLSPLAAQLAEWNEAESLTIKAAIAAAAGYVCAEPGYSHEERGRNIAAVATMDMLVRASMEEDRLRAAAPVLAIA